MDGDSFDIYDKYKNILNSLLNTMCYDSDLDYNGWGFIW